MDPRQPPQHPFSRNTASPYGRTPFPPTTSQAPFPPTSHTPQAPSYDERQRRPSDPPYYNAQRQYGQDGPQAGPAHSRHQSSSSVGHVTPVNRHMPPPSSPQQQAPQSYGPPPPRPRTVSVGPPTTFPGGRELPKLGAGGGMSISDLLSGASSSTVSRAPQHQSPVTTSGPSPIFSSTHASPRLTQSRPEYSSFTRPERPRTPEHPHQYGTRDHRSNSAGSPAGLGHYTPDAAPRYHTPQQHQYSQRVPPQEDRRAPIPPQRPTSQPSGYNMPPREVDRQPIHGGGVFGRRVDPGPRPAEARPEPSYGSRPHFEERQNPYSFEAERVREREREYQERELRDQRERERQREREILIQRENELLQREREQRDRVAQEEHMRREYAAQVAQRNQAAHSRAPEQREQPAWMRGGYDVPRHEIPRPPPYEPIPERERPSPQKVSNGYDYPVSSAPQYGGRPAYSNEPRYGPPQTSAPQHNPPQTHYESLAQQDMQRQAQERQRLQQHGYSTAPSNGSYPAHESPVRRPMEESQPMQQQRSFLGVQEMNRRGRLSPLPQAVQGPQPQLNGPGSEPSIKNEFSRMFSGIGSGVGQVPSPVPQNYAPGSQGLRREDLQTLQDLTSLYNGPTSQPKRRKMKDEDRGDDESSTGRNTPSGRGKRSRVHTHHAGHHHHHHHHRARNDPIENTSSPSLTPFKSARGAALPSPPQDQAAQGSGTHHHHVPRPHNHHVTPSKSEQQKNIVVPIPKSIIRSKSVIDSVANMPRKHLGHAYYESTLRSVGSSVKRDFSSTRGFASTPDPLPRFDGKENCTFTIKVPKIYLEHTSLSEITSRKALWGVDIYTDDSDVIAACIHHGWLLGAWSEDLENDTLLQVFDMKQDGDGNAILPSPLPINKTITTPSETGAPAPEGCDAHITVLILPVLETYGSKIRFGIRSREWGTKRDGFKSKHDGMSYKIESIRFVPANSAGEEAASGTKRKSIMNQQLSQREREAEESWGDLLMNGNGNANNSEGGFAQSFERGTGPFRAGDVMGIGWSSWWKKPVSAPAPAPAPVPAPAIDGAGEEGKGKEGEHVPVSVASSTPSQAPAPVIHHPQPLPAPEIEPLDDLELAEHISKSKSRSPMPRPVNPVVDAPAPETIPEVGASDWVMVDKPADADAGDTSVVPGGQKEDLGERERQIAEIMQRMVRNANQGSSSSAPEKGEIASETRANTKGGDEDPDTTLDADDIL